MKGGHPESFEANGRRLVLRPVALADHERLRRFINALVEEKRSNPNLAIIDPSSPMTKSEARKSLARTVKGIRLGEVISLGAFDGDALIGTCDVFRARPQEIRHVGLLDIVILEGYRGMGLGEKMICEVLKQSKELGIWLVQLRVFANNYAALRLYEKMGFRKSGTVPSMILKNGSYIDDVQMYIDLRMTDEFSPTGRRRS